MPKVRNLDETLGKLSEEITQNKQKREEQETGRHRAESFTFCWRCFCLPLFYQGVSSVQQTRALRTVGSVFLHFGVGCMSCFTVTRFLSREGAVLIEQKSTACRVGLVGFPTRTPPPRFPFGRIFIPLSLGDSHEELEQKRVSHKIQQLQKDLSEFCAISFHDVKTHRYCVQRRSKAKSHSPQDIQPFGSLKASGVFWHFQIQWGTQTPTD